MRATQIRWTKDSGWVINRNSELEQKINLVLAFGSRSILEDEQRYFELRNFYPSADILLCSSSGEICGTEVCDNSLIATAIFFEKTELKVFSTEIQSIESSYSTGKLISEFFSHQNLKHLFVISDGQNVNGSDLVRGMNEGLPLNVAVTGGLAGDGALFQKTLVGLNNSPAEKMIAAIGFYGNNVNINCSSFGGWDPFGPERLITKSDKNILYELDGQSALDLYKKYLGDRAGELPGSALLFPLSIKYNDGAPSIVRTILSIDEENKCMVFAGDMPQGSYARLMKANFERLIEGASKAAQKSMLSLKFNPPQIAILISCVGRKLVLGERVEEEVESVKEILGNNTLITGFYSYGEISPFTPGAKCELHNQTMTITTLSEV